jgi:phospholipid transport system transporter-binding protein
VTNERIVARIVAENDRWRFMGALTLDDAANVFAAAQAMPLPASGVIDLAGLTHADSSALAVVLAVKRRGAAEGRTIAVEAVPASLRSLATVYGVLDLLA